MVFNARGLVFVGRRLVEEFGEAWQMPQGGVDTGEDLREAVLRELSEETGIKSVRVEAEAPDWFRYDLPREAVGIALKGKYRGQTQKWFALRFLGEDGEVDLAAHGHPEFDAWKWVEIDEVVRLIVPFKREVYQKVVEAFRSYARPG
jgi:putative (di)nucleoside polyphosphate hydrolase